MPVLKYDDMKLAEISMDGLKDVLKANVIGGPEGWEDHTLRVFRIGPEGYTPHHKHDWPHINYIIKGKGTLTLGDKTTEVKAKDFAFVPPNTEHQFKNPFGEDFEFICIVPNVGA